MRHSFLHFLQMLWITANPETRHRRCLRCKEIHTNKYIENVVGGAFVAGFFIVFIYTMYFVTQLIGVK